MLAITSGTDLYAKISKNNTFFSSHEIFDKYLQILATVLFPTKGIEPGFLWQWESIQRISLALSDIKVVLVRNPMVKEILVMKWWLFAPHKLSFFLKSNYFSCFTNLLHIYVVNCTLDIGWGNAFFVNSWISEECKVCIGRTSLQLLQGLLYELWHLCLVC